MIFAALNGAHCTCVCDFDGLFPVLSRNIMRGFSVNSVGSQGIVVNASRNVSKSISCWTESAFPVRRNNAPLSRKYSMRRFDSVFALSKLLICAMNWALLTTPYLFKFDTSPRVLRLSRCWLYGARGKKGSVSNYSKSPRVILPSVGSIISAASLQ